MSEPIEVGDLVLSSWGQYYGVVVEHAPRYNSGAVVPAPYKIVWLDGGSEWVSAEHVRIFKVNVIMALEREKQKQNKKRSKTKKKVLYKK